jgi:tyrosyl-tRNA synthetase
MGTSELDRLLRGAAEVIPREELERKLALGRPLRVKLGLDPTAEHVTLGWAVVLRKLRRFQEAGHTAVLIVGDFTARVGDPSGKSETRPRLEKEAVQKYSDRLLDQFASILSKDRLEVRYNSEWLESIDTELILRLTASYTVARMLERDDFADRYREGRPISIMEFLYPLMQAYDSVAVEADVELGGTDQKFNLLVGREIQRDFGQEPQVVFTMPLLEGLDGVQKMSQSLGNYVGITEPPDEMFGKLMSLPDEMIVKYLALCTELPQEELTEIERGLGTGEIRPDLAKRRMAREILTLYHGESAAGEAEARFDRVHKHREVPADVPEAEIPAEAYRDGRVSLPHLVASLGMADSNSEARRLIGQRGVRIDGRVVDDPEAELPVGEVAGRIIQVGRRQFRRLKAS